MISRLLILFVCCSLLCPLVVRAQEYDPNVVYALDLPTVEDVIGEPRFDYMSFLLGIVGGVIVGGATLTLFAKRQQRREQTDEKLKSRKDQM